MVTLDALAFGAHADDVELACSGTIIKLGALGYKTGIITLTQGEMATRGTAEIRANEFEDAGEIMGLAVHKMLDIPDGRVEGTRENKQKIIEEIRAFKPRIVFAPYWVARHPDHEETSHLVRKAAYLAGLKKWDSDQEPYRPVRVLYYQTRFEFKPSFIVDISDFHKQKIKSIKKPFSKYYPTKNDCVPTQFTKHIHDNIEQSAYRKILVKGPEMGNIPLSTTLI